MALLPNKRTCKFFRAAFESVSGQKRRAVFTLLLQKPGNNGDEPGCRVRVLHTLSDSTAAHALPIGTRALIL